VGICAGGIGRPISLPRPYIRDVAATASPMANHPALESLREHRRLATSDLGEIITSGDRFAVDANTLYVYANGVYRIGEQYVHGRVKSILRELGRLREWNSGRA